MIKKNLNTIMLWCVLKNIQKYVIKKYFQIVILMSKLFETIFMQLLSNVTKC